MVAVQMSPRALTPLTLIASNERMISELERMWKEAVVT
jgi:hypothetical protein